MKKWILAAAAALSLAACNDKELGPEYTTVAQFGVVERQPEVVTSDDAVRITAPITSEYGLQQAFLLYWLDGNTDAPVKTQSIPYLETSKAVTFTATIPKQKVGTQVGYQVVAITPYNVWSWTEPATYQVDAPAAKPDERPEENSGNRQ